ncbi:hypothetical protein SK128_022051 [Halocaridina rubra]|uniref:Uncharacterized protein n=1 Tax=Halocaridina rubra TaxID=373956 RepID=A0AAN8X1R0_HALRR
MSSCSASKKNILLFIIIACIGMGLYFISKYEVIQKDILQKATDIFSKDDKEPVLDQTWPLPVEQSRRLAATLANVHREIYRLVGE